MSGGLGHPGCELAFELIAEGREPGMPAPEDWSGRGPSVTWRCCSCGERVTDRGPYEGAPDNNEQGHAAGCERHGREIAGYGQLASVVGSPAAGNPQTDPAVVAPRAPAGSGEVWALVAAAQRGDREAFGQLYARYAGVVSRFVGSRVRGDRALTQDLTSETFLRALRGIGSVRDRGRDPGAWLVTIARNLVLDHVKSSRYRLERTTANLPDRARDDCGPEQAVIRNETVAELRRCVAALPRDQQECIRLRFLQELSVADTAAVLGRSDRAVRGLTHRGVQQLRAALARNSTRPVPPAREATVDPLDARAVDPPRHGHDRLARARRAVSEVAHRVAGDGRRQAAEQDRARQLARWHADDQGSARVADTGAVGRSAAGGAALESKPVSVQAPFTCYPGGQYRYERVQERRAALVAALVGVELGAYDRRIVGWLARDAVSTVATVVSLILRARDPAGPSIVATELRRIAVEMDPRSGQPSDSPDPEPINRTRSRWADYLRVRAEERDPHGGGW